MVQQSSKRGPIYLNFYKIFDYTCWFFVINCKITCKYILIIYDYFQNICNSISSFFALLQSYFIAKWKGGQG